MGGGGHRQKGDKGKCGWCTAAGHTSKKCPIRIAGKPRVVANQDNLEGVPHIAGFFGGGAPAQGVGPAGGGMVQQNAGPGGDGGQGVAQIPPSLGFRV